MADSRPRIVLDTVIYLQASISTTNVASSILKRADADEIELYASKALVEEARDVLNRPSIRLKNARLSDEELARFLQSIESKAIMIDPLPTHYRYGREPGRGRGVPPTISRDNHSNSRATALSFEPTVDSVTRQESVLRKG